MTNKLKQADKLWGQAMHALNHACAKCGDYGGLHAHHIIHKTHHLTRHDLLNGCLLCYKCHAWAHGHPRAFMDWLYVNRTAQWSWAQRNKNRTGKPEYEQAIKELREVINGR